MGNIKNYNFNKVDFNLSNSDYWDLYLANDSSSFRCDSLSAGSCFVVWYDFNNSNIFPYGNDSIYSLVSWTGATNTGYTLNTIGLTGIDNGLVKFQKNPSDHTNQALLSALTESTLVIPANEKRLVMHKVTGSTGNIHYPSEIVSDSTHGNYARLNGGFYQGYYKLDGHSYEVLPTRVEQAWAAEFWLKPEALTSEGETLNDFYPENKGFFFYMGTRAENKFWNKWEGADTGCTSGCELTKVSAARAGATRNTENSDATMPPTISALVGDAIFVFMMDPFLGLIDCFVGTASEVLTY